MEWEGLEDATRYVTIVPSAERCVTVLQQKLEITS
jgi:hypothetical protein